MGKKYTNTTYNFTDGLSINGGFPVDDRLVVKYRTDLFDGNTITSANAYKGMVVAVVDDSTASNNGLYQLTDVTDLNSGWVKIADKDYVDIRLSGLVSGMSDLQNNITSLSTSVNTVLPMQIANKADNFDLGNGLEFTTTGPKTLNLNLNQLQIGNNTYSLVAGDEAIVIDIPTSSGPSGPISYDSITNKPQLNGETITGNKNVFEYSTFLTNWETNSTTVRNVFNIIFYNKPGIIILEDRNNVRKDNTFTVQITNTDKTEVYFKDRGVFIGIAGGDLGVFGYILDGNNYYKIEEAPQWIQAENRLVIPVTKYSTSLSNIYNYNDLSDYANTQRTAGEWYTLLYSITDNKIPGLYYFSGANLMFNYSDPQGSAAEDTIDHAYIMFFELGRSTGVTLQPLLVISELGIGYVSNIEVSNNACMVDVTSTLSYGFLKDKPTINGVELIGDLTSEDLNIATPVHITIHRVDTEDPDEFDYTYDYGGGEWTSLNNPECASAFVDFISDNFDYGVDLTIECYHDEQEDMWYKTKAVLSQQLVYDGVAPSGTNIINIFYPEITHAFESPGNTITNNLVAVSSTGIITQLKS